YDGWLVGLQSDAGVRRDLAKVLRGVTSKETMRAIAVLRRFDRPTLLVWGRRDRFFTPAYAERLAGDIPGARLEWLPDARTFVPLDAPGPLASHLKEFARAGVTG